MKVWAIADLHLSFARPERRDRFAGRWRDHAAKVEANWTEVVKREDLVLLPGDLSMARNHRDLQPDLHWLDKLAGTKVFAPGNHDSWWNGPENVRPMLRGTLHAVGGDAIVVGDVIVCGSKGAPPLSGDLSPEQQAEANRQQLALERALGQARELRKSAQQPVYLLWHYPPFDAFGRAAPWVSAFEEAKITACVYGHLHTEGQWSRATQGNIRGVRYYCVAADAVGFRPLLIDSW
jgi:uncharacterized protein